MEEILSVAGPFHAFRRNFRFRASADWNEKTIRDNLQLVAEWQAKHPKKRSPLHWTYGAFYSGLVQYGLSVPEGPGLPLLRKKREKSRNGRP